MDGHALMSLEEFRIRYREAKRERTKRTSPGIKNRIMAKIQSKGRAEHAMELINTGLTSAQVAEILGLHKTTINGYIREARSK